MIKIMLDHPGIGFQVLTRAAGPVRELYREPVLEFGLRLLDRAVVRRVVNRAIHRQDKIVGEHAVDRRMIQVAAVVPLEEQGRAETIEGRCKITGYSFAAANLSRHGSKLIAGGEILHLVQVRLGDSVMLPVFARVHGPRDVRHVPADAPEVLAMISVLIMPRSFHHSLQFPP